MQILPYAAMAGIHSSGVGLEKKEARRSSQIKTSHRLHTGQEMVISTVTTTMPGNPQGLGSIVLCHVGWQRHRMTINGSCGILGLPRSSKRCRPEAVLTLAKVVMTNGLRNSISSLPWMEKTGQRKTKFSKPIRTKTVCRRMTSFRQSPQPR